MVSPVDALVQGAVASVVGFLGGGRTSTYQRRHSLFDSASGQSASLVLASDAEVGDEEVELRAASGTLSGSLPAGFALTIAGETYLSSASTRAVAGVVAVPLSSAVAVAGTEGDAVGLGETVELTWVRQTGMVSDADYAMPGMTEAARVELLVAKEGYPAPEVDDISADGLRVLSVETIGDRGAPAGYRVVVGVNDG